MVSFMTISQIQDFEATRKKFTLKSRISKIVDLWNGLVTVKGIT